MAINATSRENIETIIRLEERQEDKATAIELAAERIGKFAGTLSFVACQVVFAILWVIVNAGLTPVPVIDPFPYVLLAGFFAFETLVLTAFVLIRQQRMTVRADRRNHLNLQISLLAEKEATKIIQMLDRLSRELAPAAVDHQAQELGKETAVEGIAEELREKLDS